MWKALLLRAVSRAKNISSRNETQLRRALKFRACLSNAFSGSVEAVSLHASCVEISTRFSTSIVCVVLKQLYIKLITKHCACKILFCMHIITKLLVF